MEYDFIELVSTIALKFLFALLLGVYFCVLFNRQHEFVQQAASPPNTRTKMGIKQTEE